MERSYTAERLRTMTINELNDAAGELEEMIDFGTVQLDNVQEEIDSREE